MIPGSDGPHHLRYNIETDRKRERERERERETRASPPDGPHHLSATLGSEYKSWPAAASVGGRMVRIYGQISVMFLSSPVMFVRLDAHDACHFLAHSWIVISSLIVERMNHHIRQIVHSLWGSLPAINLMADGRDRPTFTRSSLPTRARANV